MFCMSLFCAVNVGAQTPDAEETATEIDIVEDESFCDMNVLDEYPEFPGGISGLMDFLCDNIVYPSACVKDKIQGKVLVKFAVMKDGSVGNVQISHPVHPALDAEAMRVVKMMPRWKPGRCDGENVNVWYVLPVSFRL